MKTHTDTAQTNSLEQVSLAGCPSLAVFDYGRTEPFIVQETAQWAVVYKPPQLPTAPLHADETNTLVYWFLRTQAVRNAEQQFCSEPCPRDNPADSEQSQLPYGSTHYREPQRMHTVAIHTSEVAQVRGKKAIEVGLLHRLDTGTRGLVLFAKTQACYDFLSARQDSGELCKTYYAFTAPWSAALCKRTAEPVCVPQQSPAGCITAQLPFSIVSQFRNFGPGAKRVAPVFAGSRHYKEGNRLYTTVVEAVDVIDSYTSHYGKSRTPVLSGSSVSKLQLGEYISAVCRPELGEYVIRGFRCSLTRGYRHQVRAHLASLGFPIIGDPLYAQPFSAIPVIDSINIDTQAQKEPYPDDSNATQCPGLQLYAIGLRFPDPENPQQNISVVLPPPDKMSR